jgi:hypothetical protein
MYRPGRFSLVFLPLLALLILQLGLVTKEESLHPAPKRPIVRAQATWAYLANNLSVATNLSREILVGHVVQVLEGPDLPSCAADDDHLAANLITIVVEQIYKGNPNSTFTLFQTAPIIDVKQDTLNQPRGTLNDDPPYATGERYLLFLRDGPLVNGNPTKVMLAPETRMRVTNGVLETFSERGFGPEMNGKPLTLVVQQVMTLDTDGDGVPDRLDNCPTCFNPQQTLPPWPVPADDPDCDGFNTKMDDFTGGLPLVACPNTPAPGDEVKDAWPPDFNDDQRVDALDAMILQPLIGAIDISDCETGAEDPRYNHRFDLNADFRINAVDGMMLQAFMGRSCFGCAGTTGTLPPSAPAPGLVLAQNEPNPFDPAVRGFTRIAFAVPGTGGAGTRATLRIFDPAGRVVRTLVDAVVPPSEQIAQWDGRDASGRLVPAGVYFYRLDAGGSTLSQKLVVLSSRR